MKQRYTDLRVDDWVQARSGRVFRIAAVVPVTATLCAPGDYGPRYVDENGGSALACAVIEVRRKPSRESQEAPLSERKEK